MKLYEYGYLLEALQEVGGRHEEAANRFARMVITASEPEAVEAMYKYIETTGANPADVGEACYLAIMDALNDHREKCGIEAEEKEEEKKQ